MAIRCAINGFGRIGRLVLRSGFADPELEFVAVNDLTDAKTLGYLVRYDSVHGIWARAVEAREKAIAVEGREIRVLSESDPYKLP